MWNRLAYYFQAGRSTDYEQQRAAILAQAPIPIIWLFGKTGSGKTSLIRYLTGATDAEIGNGFQPQTRHTLAYSFPDDETPLVKFLDTRGLGEAQYDHAADIEKLQLESHLVVVTVRAMDHSLDELKETWQHIRKCRPKRPVLLVLTALHDAYPGQPHPADLGDTANWPIDLQRSLELQKSRFAGLFDKVVEVDLTTPEDQLEPTDYRGRLLKEALLELLPAAYRHTLSCLENVEQALGDLSRRRCAPIIMAHSVLSASTAAFPIPWVDIPAVFAIQTHLAKQIAAVYQQPLDKTNLAKIMGVVGGAVAVQTGLRQGLKLIPYVGMAANAASTFGITFAAGWAWQWYFSQCLQGHLPTNEELKQQFREQLQAGAKLWSVQSQAAP
jgi:uncharacterized protein (DUF697 family)/predicted GTPase